MRLEWAISRLPWYGIGLWLGYYPQSRQATLSVKVIAWVASLDLFWGGPCLAS